MFPILFKIGSLEFFSYGLMMALGVLAGLAVVLSETKRYGWDQDRMTRLVVFTFLAGLLGSRVVYVFTRMGDPNVSVMSLLLNVRAGFVYYGGLVGAWLFLLWQVKRQRLPMWPTMDMFAMGICIGLGLGRIGCLLGGCCYGSVTDLPWGMVMEGEKHLGHLHPVQLYEFLFLAALFGASWARRKAKAYDGELVVWFVGSYAIARYVLEIYRGDLIRGFVIEGVMSTSQFISVPMLAFAAFLHFRLRGRKVLQAAPKS